MKCCSFVLLVEVSCFRAAQSVKILIALAVYCTYGLQFYVCVEIAWNGIKNTFTKRPIISEYAMRTFLITLTGK
jgi:proton-coupled amino acid transporter